MQFPTSLLILEFAFFTTNPKLSFEALKTSFVALESIFEALKMSFVALKLIFEGL
jgi:hypothetical protein